MAQLEYRVRKVGAIVRVQRVKGLLNTDQFSFKCTMAECKAWIKQYEQSAWRDAPIILNDPYLTESHIVPMIRV